MKHSNYWLRLAPAPLKKQVYYLNTTEDKDADDGENCADDNNFDNMERTDIDKASRITSAFSPDPAGWDNNSLCNLSRPHTLHRRPPCAGSGLLDWILIRQWEDNIS